MRNNPLVGNRVKSSSGLLPACGVPMEGPETSDRDEGIRKWKPEWNGHLDTNGT